MGQIVYSETLSKGMKEKQFNIESLPSGVIIVKIAEGGNQHYYKIIKE